MKKANLKEAIKTLYPETTDKELEKLIEILSALYRQPQEENKK